MEKWVKGEKIGRGWRKKSVKNGEICEGWRSEWWIEKWLEDRDVLENREKSEKDKEMSELWRN